MLPHSSLKDRRPWPVLEFIEPRFLGTSDLHIVQPKGLLARSSFLFISESAYRHTQTLKQTRASRFRSTLAIRTVRSVVMVAGWLLPKQS